jgi:hypothetical protein
LTEGGDVERHESGVYQALISGETPAILALPLAYQAIADPRMNMPCNAASPE